MAGYAYIRDNNGTKEGIVFDKDSGKKIALSGFSGYLAISGGIINEGLKAAGAVTKGTAIGKIYAITDGIISGVFDKQGNPDKSMNDVVGTALDKNDINFVAKREYVKNIKIASNLDNFRSFKESHL